MNQHTRRRFLAAGAAACTTVAGCLGGGSTNADPDEIDTEDRPALGAEDAPVRVTAFIDFSCPGCRQFEDQIFPLIFERHVQTGQVRYLHADFPIPVDGTWSWAVASAARAVFAEAGNDPFWEFVTNIFRQQGSYSYDVLETVANDVAGAGTAARTAAEEETYRDAVEADRDRGEDWGVSGTPTVFVADSNVDPSYEEIQSAIEDER